VTLGQAPFVASPSFLSTAWLDAAAGDVVDRWYRIGDLLVHLSFAGPAVVPWIDPAFAHLRSTPGEADFTVHIWDSASTGAPGPSTPPVRDDEAAGAFYFFEDPPVRGVYQPGLGALSVVDLSSATAWYWVRDPGVLPYWEKAGPLRQILHWYMATEGRQQVHGGAVGTPEGGVLLVGRGGSGKSTCSLASLVTELRYAGDDYVMVSIDPEPWIHSLYSSGKVDPHNLERVPHLRPAVTNADRLDKEKAVIFVDQHFPDRPIAGFPLRAVVLPTITGGPVTRAVPTTSAAALGALAPSTVFQLHTAGREAFSFMAALVRRVPAFVLELGDDASAIPVVLDDLLASLARPPS
jgi:hypothetical protein